MAIFLFLLSVFLPGLALMSFWYPRPISGWRLFALAYGAGAFLLAFELFLYFVILRGVDGPFLPYFFAIQTTALCAAAAWRFPWKTEFAPLCWPSRGWIAAAAALGIAVLLALSLVQALAKPPVAFDAVSFWGARAKILLAQGKVDFDPSSATYLSAPASRNYPWQFSLLEYWIRRLGADGGEVQVISWLSYFSLCCLLADFSGHRLGWNKGLCFTFLFAAQPLLFYHASNNYADLAVAYYAAAGFAFFLEWLESKRVSLLLMAAAWTAATFNLKHYGAFYILILLGGVAAAWLMREWRPDWKKVAALFLAIVVPVAPVALFKLFFHLNLRNSAAAWVWHPEIVRSLAAALFQDASWNIWWPVLAVVFLSMLQVIRRQKRLILAWGMLFSLIACLLAIFALTENFRWALDRTVISRSFLPVLALSAVLAAYTLSYHPSLSYAKPPARL